MNKMNLGWQDTRYSNHDVLQDNSTLKKHTHPLSVNGKSSRQGATSSSYDSGSHHNTSATSDTLDSDDDVLPSERSPKVGLIKPSRIIPVYMWEQFLEVDPAKITITFVFTVLLSGENCTYGTCIWKDMFLWVGLEGVNPFQIGRFAC